MSEVETVGRFACEGCGKRYRWRREWAGRKLKCKCGGVAVCPPTDPARAAAAAAQAAAVVADDDMYDIAPDAPPPQPPLAEPVALAAPAPVMARAAGPVVPGTAHVPQPVMPVPSPSPSPRSLGYQSAPVGDGALLDAYFPDKVKDLYTPLYLIGGGLVVELFAAAFRYRGGGPTTMALGFTEVGVKLIFGTLFMLAGILIAAKLRGLDLGKFWTAVLKLVAISIAPGAVVTLATPILMLLPLIGTLIGWGIDFCLYFALIGMLFDLDESDTWFCVFVIFGLKVAVALTILWGMPTWLHR
jgi:hypothetical protein